jgi:hypothetical protein
MDRFAHYFLQKIISPSSIKGSEWHVKSTVYNENSGKTLLNAFNIWAASFITFSSREALNDQVRFWGEVLSIHQGCLNDEYVLGKLLIQTTGANYLLVL